jgi:hypothetical protein
MVKQLQRLAVSVPVYLFLVTTFFALFPRDWPPTLFTVCLTSFFFVLSFVLFIGFGAAFVAGFSRWPFLLPSPIVRFTVPIACGVSVLIGASLLGAWLGSHLRHILA